MSASGEVRPAWGCGVEGKPSAMLQAALRTVRRNGNQPRDLPECNGPACDWVRRVAECLRSGTCQVAVLFCDDSGLACCVANKVPGVRAAAVWTLAQARRALDRLGANLLVVEADGRTFYECKELLRLCCDREPACCPPGVACTLQELDGHAHR
jgi:hypothetical protein